MVKKFRERKPYRFEYSLLLYTIEVAVFAAFCSIVFNLLVYYLSGAISYASSTFSYFYLVVLVAVMLIFFLASRFVKPSGSYGVRAIKYELSNIDRKMMSTKNAVSKIILTAVSIVGGLSVGTFGPTVHIGGFIGSNIAYRRNLSEDQIRVLVGTGVAAALSAVMRTPLFAAIVVLELFFLDRRFEYLFPVLTSSFIAVNIDKVVLGNHHVDFFAGVFRDMTRVTWSESVLEVAAAVFLISVLSGFVAILYIKTLHFFEKHHIRKEGSFSYIAFAIIVTAILVLFSRRLLYLDLSVLNVDFVLRNSVFVPLLFLVAKLLLISLQLGFGVHGGNFKPGVYLGLLVGLVIYKLFVIMGISGFSLEFIMLISMTAMISGFAKAPLSAVILAIELSSQVSLIVPLIAASLLAYFTNLFIIDRDINSEIN